MSDEDIQGEVTEDLEPELSLEEMIQAEEDKPAEVEDYLANIPEEDRQYAKGWKPNGPKSLEWFISDGKLIAKVEHLSKKDKERDEELKQRVADVNKLYQLQIIQKDKQLAEAEQRFRDAVNMSDMEEVKAAQADIDKLNAIDLKAPVATVNSDDDNIAAEWDAKNQWINVANRDHPLFDPTSPDVPKALYAQKVIKDLFLKGIKASDIVSQGLIEKAIAEKFPTPQKQGVQKHIQPNIVNRSSNVKASFESLSREDKDFYSKTQSMWASKEQYAQAVYDDKAARG